MLLVRKYECNLDKDRRLCLPRIIWEETMKRRWFLQADKGQIELLPEETLRQDAAELGLDSLFSIDEERQDFYSGTYEAEPDMQGRLTIPKDALNSAGIIPPCKLDILGNKDRYTFKKIAPPAPELHLL